jgi:ATP-dependent exoDNAse (exonuclease V) beta subunit
MNILNTHKRDDRITFDEEPHIYYIDGCSNGYISSTTIIHSMFTPFDKEKVAKFTHNKYAHNQDSEYYQMSPDDIIAKWSTNTAAAEGTRLHKDIELYLDGQRDHNDSIEFNYFLQFMKDNTHLQPYRTEWMIFDDVHKIAGSIDVVFERPDKKLIIGDWKRVKTVRHSNQYQFGLNGLEHLQDCNFIHYALQLNLYRYILETFYDKEIAEMFLVVLHPINDKYMKITVPKLYDDIFTLLDTRKRV